jgi:hypothetical protein
MWQVYTRPTSASDFLLVLLKMCSNKKDNIYARIKRFERLKTLIFGVFLKKCMKNPRLPYASDQHLAVDFRQIFASIYILCNKITTTKE